MDDILHDPRRMESTVTERNDTKGAIYTVQLDGYGG